MSEENPNTSVENTNIAELAQLIADGAATEDQQGLALKAIKTAMSVSMAQGMRTMMQPMDTLSRLVDSAVDALAARWEAESQSMPVKQLTAFIESIQNKQIQMLDLYRKTIQGHDLIQGESLTEDEKLVLRLFKSFKTEAEKKRFLDLCRRELGNE